MTIIAVIPARGGSRRLPRKNIRVLDGTPLIAFSIRAAVDSAVFDRVIVSTDDAEIAAIARDYGAEIPFLRDSQLADDFSPVSHVTIDALDRLQEECTAVAQLMPNCPFRTAADVRSSFVQFTEGTAGTQLSVTSYGWLNPWWAQEVHADSQLLPLFPTALVSRSQDLQKLVCPSGAIWWARPQILREHRTFYAPGYSGFELPWDRALDIDDEADWQMAEAVVLMKHRT